MIGSLLKIPLKVVGLQLKLALLPARLAARVVRKLLRPDSDSRPEGSSPHSYEPAAARGGASRDALDTGPSTGDLEVQPEELRELLEARNDVLLIDVRQAQELADAGLIEGSLHIPSQDLPHRLEDLDKEKVTVVYCRLGGRSMDAAMFMREKGFTDVRSLGGGLVGWQSDGGAVRPS